MKEKEQLQQDLDTTAAELAASRAVIQALRDGLQAEDASPTAQDPESGTSARAPLMGIKCGIAQGSGCDQLAPVYLQVVSSVQLCLLMRIFSCVYQY